MSRPTRRKSSASCELLVITQNGEVRMVIEDLAYYEQTQETIALLKILVLGNRQIEEGRFVSRRSRTNALGLLVGQSGQWRRDTEVMALPF